MRRFPAPWTVEQTPGGFKVLDANGQSLAYVYGRETKAEGPQSCELVAPKTNHHSRGHPCDVMCCAYRDSR
jgi:hypothetical protein